MLDLLNAISETPKGYELVSKENIARYRARLEAALAGDTDPRHQQVGTTLQIRLRDYVLDHSILDMIHGAQLHIPARGSRPEVRFIVTKFDGEMFVGRMIPRLVTCPTCGEEGFHTRMHVEAGKPIREEFGCKNRHNWTVEVKT